MFVIIFVNNFKTVILCNNENLFYLLPKWMLTQVHKQILSLKILKHIEFD